MKNNINIYFLYLESEQSFLFQVKIFFFFLIQCGYLSSLYT